VISASLTYTGGHPQGIRFGRAIRDFRATAVSQPRATSLSGEVLASLMESYEELKSRAINQSLTNPADP